MTGRPDSTAVRYIARAVDTGHCMDPDSVFRAMTDDLLHDADVELAMHKAFRWGFQDDQGDKAPGLRDLMQRLREDRRELLESLSPEGSGEPGISMDEAEGIAGEDVDPGDRDADCRAETLKLAGQMEAMERSLRQIERLDDLQGLDSKLMEAVLTDDEREWVQQWSSMRVTLAGEGLILAVGDQLEPTPRAIRRIGERALMTIFSTLREGIGGDHDTGRRGRTGALGETTSPWKHGDPFALDLSRTLMNSVRRHGGGTPVRVTSEDFEVFDRESREASATVLLIDMSRSMFYNGCWDAAKQSALALDTLMRGQFQRDDLELAGFSERAERITLMQLPLLQWNEFSHGTNLQDGLRLARELLRPFKSKTRQIILITDGEPTAFIKDGKVTFENPPTERTFDATLREVIRCTRENITINTFLLGQSVQLTSFVENVARINRGRVIHATADTLGNYLVRDFLTQRKAMIG